MAAVEPRPTIEGRAADPIGELCDVEDTAANFATVFIELSRIPPGHRPKQQNKLKL